MTEIRTCSGRTHVGTYRPTGHEHHEGCTFLPDRTDKHPYPTQVAMPGDPDYAQWDSVGRPGAPAPPAAQVGDRWRRETPDGAIETLTLTPGGWVKVVEP